MQSHATKSPSKASEPELIKDKDLIKGSGSKTYEAAEAVELTRNESEKLSRSMLLKWFQAKKYEKLKGLQEHILELSRTPSELDDFKEKIIENTRKELAKLNKELTSKEIKTRAEKFGEALVGVAHGIGNVKSVIEDFERELMDEKMFHEYVGSVGGVVGSSNLKIIRNHPQVKKFIDSQPGLAEDLDKAIESGDYDNVRSVLLQVPEFKGKEAEIDVLLGLAMEHSNQSQGVQGMIEGAIKWVGGMPKKVLDGIKSSEKLIRSKVYIPVAKRLGVELATLRNVSGFTVLQLNERARVFKKYRHLIEEKIRSTKDPRRLKKLDKQLQYIDEVIIIANEVEVTKQKHGSLITDHYEKRLETLRKAGKITMEDKIRILGQMNIDSVKVSMFMPLMNYENEKDIKQESNLRFFGLLAGRAKRIHEAYKLVGGDVSKKAAHGIAGVGRLWRQNARKFKKTFGQYPSGNKLTNMFDDLSKKVNAYHASNIDNAVPPAEINRRQRTRAYTHDIKGHDDIVRMYYEASQHASKILSQEAQKVIGAGKELDTLMKGMGDPSKIIDAKKVPKSMIDVLYEGKKPPLNFSGNTLQRAYTERLMEVRVARDVAQESFAQLSQNIKTKVVGGIESKWLRNRDIRKGIDDVAQGVGRVENLVRERMTYTGKAKYFATRFGLPAVAVGVPLADLARGKARFRDVKWDLFDTAIGFVPIAGTVNDFKQMWTGKTTSGRKLSFREQVISGAFGVVGAISDAAWVLGGLGGVMRAGLGSLRAGRKIANVGKLSKSVKAVQSAEGYGLLHKFGLRVGGWFSTAKRVENVAESAAKVRAYNYLSIQKKLKAVEGFDDVHDLKSAENFADALKGTKHADAANEYVKMMRFSGGVDYYKSLTQSFGIAGDAPRLLGIRTSFHKTMNYVRKAFIKNPKQIERLNDMEKTADAYQALKVEKLTALEKYREAVQKGEGVEDALKNLKAVETKFITQAKDYAKVQEEIFATAEKLSQTHRLVTQVAKYASYGGFALAGYMMLTGKSPKAKTIVEGGKTVAGGAWGVTKTTFRHASSTYEYQPPIEDIIDSAIKHRAEEISFAKKIKEIEDSNATDKKQQIENFCAKNWWRDSVRTWAYRHKDKLDIRRIINKAKKLYRPQLGGGLKDTVKKAVGVPGAGK